MYHVEFDLDFKRNPYKGLYIALEGIDGSGKTLQTKKLVEYFEKQGKNVVKTREPRKHEGIIGKFVQEILQGDVAIPHVAFQYLFTADRAVHHEELIIPSLKEGKVVISDRCLWSAVPYGILDREESVTESAKVPLLVSQSILSLYHQFMIPDYTFYLDVTADEAWSRIPGKEEKREVYEKREFLEKLVRGYKLLLQEFPKEFIVIDGKKSVEEVTTDIIKRIRNHELGKRKHNS